MGVYNPEGPAAFGYLGVIEAAVRLKATTSRVWDAVRAEATRTGRAQLGVSFGDVTAIRSWAVKMRNADATYAAADPAATIDSTMVTTAIWSPNDLNTIATTPSFSVRARATVQQPDGTVTTQWLTWNYADNPFNSTVGEYTNTLTGVLAARVQTAPEDTNTPTGTLLAVDSINIQVF